MKLHRIVSTVQALGLAEAQGPVSVALTLDEIIKAGKVTNPYQIFVLGWLSEFFKNGLKSAKLELESPITFGSAATSSVVVDGLKTMSPENQVQLAQYLKDCVAAGECALHHKDLSIVDWMSFVIHSQK
jgi:hypothetical protein